MLVSFPLLRFKLRSWWWLVLLLLPLLMVVLLAYGLRYRYADNVAATQLKLLSRF